MRWNNCHLLSKVRVLLFTMSLSCSCSCYAIVPCRSPYTPHFDEKRSLETVHHPLHGPPEELFCNVGFQPLAPDKGSRSKRHSSTSFFCGSRCLPKGIFLLQCDTLIIDSRRRKVLGFRTGHRHGRRRYGTASTPSGLTVRHLYGSNKLTRWGEERPSAANGSLIEICYCTAIPSRRRRTAFECQIHMGVSQFHHA